MGSHSVVVSTTSPERVQEILRQAEHLTEALHVTVRELIDVLRTDSAGDAAESCSGAESEEQRRGPDRDNRPS